VRGEALKAVKGEKTETSIGVWICPECKAECHSLLGEEDGSSKCEHCQAVVAHGKEELKALITERKVTGYMCPLCKETIPDTPSNWSGETTNGTKAVMCPQCHVVLNGRPLIHHGELSEEFKPSYRGTDYFEFRHVTCREGEHRGRCLIYAALIDNQGRIIFNLECRDCGRIDALKTHTYLMAKGETPGGEDHTIEAIYLSPELRSRIGKHYWDDL